MVSFRNGEILVLQRNALMLSLRLATTHFQTNKFQVVETRYFSQLATLRLATWLIFQDCKVRTLNFTYNIAKDV